MPTGLLSELMLKFEASATDLILLILGLFVVGFVVVLERRRTEQIKINEKRRDEQIRELWSQINENKRKYAALNAWTYGAAVAIQAHTQIKLIKQSANGESDFTLNRDIN